MSIVSDRMLHWVERGQVPDPMIRFGIRQLLRQRIDELQTTDVEAVGSRTASFIAMMDSSPIAPMPEKANQQHYELPATFFAAVLGAQRKYSSCYWRHRQQTLDQAENDALRITCERAGIKDGMRVLELGCGWGSLSLWMARHYPRIQVTAVSNSAGQREYIERRADTEGLKNIELITADMNEFEAGRQFDCIVSLEMFEHMRNYRKLFARIHDWLAPGGNFFMHIFCHRLAPYEFVERDASDWMSRYFFSGGIMPSDSLPLYFQNHLRLDRHWRWSGQHYARTLNAWLARMDQRKSSLMPILQATYGDETSLWWMRWRLFFMACAELFGYNRGQEWWVSHYLFTRPPLVSTLSCI